MSGVGEKNGAGGGGKSGGEDGDGGFSPHKYHHNEPTCEEYGQMVLDELNARTGSNYQITRGEIPVLVARRRGDPQEQQQAAEENPKKEAREAEEEQKRAEDQERSPNNDSSRAPSPRPSTSPH